MSGSGEADRPRDIIDVHAHALTAEFLAACHQLDPALGVGMTRDRHEMRMEIRGHQMGPFPISFIDPDSRLAQMDQDGIQAHALSSPPYMFLYDKPAALAEELSAALNDSLIAWSRTKPDRLRVLASLPMQSPEAAIREVARIASDPAVCGVAIGSHIAGNDLDAPELLPVFQRLAKENLPVLIHPVTSPDGRPSRHFLRNLIGNPVDTTIAAGSLMFGGVLDAAPTLRVCLVHGGGFLPFQIGRLTHGFARVEEARRTSVRSPAEMIPQLFFDTILHDAAAIRFMAGQVGWSQVVVGTDFPFEMGDGDPHRTLESLDHPPDVRTDLRSGNALRFLRWQPPAAADDSGARTEATI